ncbi:MAG: IreB family regulatory phosphoprotein [Eubacterium sp.]|nr:IreB family regulatory phosphoprotein [Eubacterium sp.]
MTDINHTQYFEVHTDQEVRVNDVLERVYDALTQKGYNPVSQIVGYVMSGDPTYITSHMGARSLIMKVERDEIVEELLRTYIDTRLARD